MVPGVKAAGKGAKKVVPVTKDVPVKAAEACHATKIRKMIGKLKYIRDHAKKTSEDEKKDTACMLRRHSILHCVHACLHNCILAGSTGDRRHGISYTRKHFTLVVHNPVCVSMHLASYASTHIHTEEADAALILYSTITDKASRTSFIEQFESSGSGKGKDSLKFALTFKKHLSSTDSSACGSNDSFVTRAGVLARLGMRLCDFDSHAEAFAVPLVFSLNITKGVKPRIKQLLLCMMCSHACIPGSTSRLPTQSCSKMQCNSSTAGR